MKKFIALLLVVLVIFSCQSKKQDSEKEVIKIGAILPLTGDAAIYGKAMQNGIELAREESNSKESIQILYEDDKGEQSAASSAITLLLSKNIDVLIGGAQSKTANVIIPKIEQDKIPMIAPGASSVDFDESTSYFMRVWSSDSYDGKILGEYVAENTPKNEGIAVFYTGSKYGEGIKQVFERVVREEGNNIVFSERFNEGINDYRTQIQKIKESKAKVLFLPGYYSEVKTIVKQITELGLKDIQIYGTSSFHDQKLLDELGDVLNGIIFSYPEFDIDGNNEKTVNFAENYNEKFGLKADIFAAYAYDCFRLIDYAISNGAKNAIEIQKQIINVQDFDGAGGTFSFDQFGNVIKKFSIYKISNNNFIKLY